MGLESNIPKGWTRKTLGEVCKNISRRFNFKEKENVVFVNTGDVLNGKFLHHERVSKEGLPGQAKKAVEFGDILYSEIRPANKRFALVDFDSKDYVVSTKFMVLKKNEDVDLDFLYLFLTSNKIIRAFQSHAEARSGTFPQITFDTISFDEILTPPLPEQKAIAKVLTSFDDKIELLQAQNKTLETMAQTIFKEWFGKYQIGDELPEGWKVGVYGDLVDLSSGKGVKKKEYIENGKYEIIGANGIIGRLNKFLVEERVIVTGRVGTLGTVFILNHPCWISDNVLISKPLMDNSFYFSYFKLKSFNFSSLNTGSTQPLITQGDLKSIEIIIPNKSFLKEFEKVSTSFFEKIKNNNLAIQSLTKTRDTLLPKLMSGQVRVNNLKQTADA